MMLRLPTIPQSQLNVKPINWTGLPRKYMNPGELEVLIALIKGVSPRNVLEIGVNEGRTAKAILDNIPSIKGYQGIDVMPGYTFAKVVQRGEIPPYPGKYAIHDPRFELLLEARGSFDIPSTRINSCDACFIDGDHSSSAVQWDTQIAMARVRPGGIIIWHDYHDLGTVDVREVLNAYMAAGMKITHVENTWLAYMRTPH